MSNSSNNNNTGDELYDFYSARVKPEPIPLSLKKEIERKKYSRIHLTLGDRFYLVGSIKSNRGLVNPIYQEIV